VEVVLIIVAVLALALMAMALAGLRPRPPRGRTSAPRRRSGLSHAIRARCGGRRADPMAEAVVRHSQVLDPADVAVEELRLRAQANRVVAAAHEREARGDAAADDARRLEAEGHRNAAAGHERAADELERRAALGAPPPPPPPATR